MVAITTKYLGATDFKSSRIKAKADKFSLTIPYDHSFAQSDGPFRKAAEALRDKMEWSGELISGCLPDGNYVFVFK